MKMIFSSKLLLAVLVGGLVTLALWQGLRPKATPAARPQEQATPAAEPKEAAAATSPSTFKPAPAEGLPPVIPIPLTNWLTAADLEEAQTDGSAQTFPSGTQVYGGIEFWLQGRLVLKALEAHQPSQGSFRSNIVVPLDETLAANGTTELTHRGSNIACLYLLGGSIFNGARSGQTVARVLWHYTDGTTATNALNFNEHLRDWWRPAFEEPNQLPSHLTKVAWHGPNPRAQGSTWRFYRITCLNDHPEKVIDSLEFASAMARSSLFLLAATLDPLPPGSRPDGLTSEEMPDPELAGQLQLLVQDTRGLPLAKARVSAKSKAAEMGSLSRNLLTDAAGLALVRYPDAGLESLEVAAELEGYSGRKMLWDVKSGDSVPATYTLKLAAEVTIGGTVVEGGDTPIPGAEVQLLRFWNGHEGDPNRKGEQASFSHQKQTTDAQGRWQARGLPPDLLDHIMFEVKHPDFLSTNVNVAGNPNVEKQLREGTHKLVLQRGMEVSGRVLDEQENPVAGAKVWSGRKFSRERQETQSDSQGRFSFHSVGGGNILFSVMAKGHCPESQTVTVQPGMGEILFHLKAGSVIRAHVQDESGQPVADARVGLEGRPGEAAYDAYEFSGKTDSQGDFSWESAPNETMPFYIFHSGFEAKRGVKLAANQDNTVTMHRSRQLQGQVLDASSGQPVTKFSFRTGHASPDDSNVYGVIRYHDISAADGRFSISLEEESDDAIDVSADGYADQVQRLPAAQAGVVQTIIRLKPSAGVAGVVLAPDGTPASGVTVAFASEVSGRTFIQLSGGRLKSFDSRSKVTTTDAEGHFQIASVEDAGNVVAAGAPGFGQAPLAAVRDSGVLRLQSWGRIEGVLKIGGQPGAGKELLFTISLPGIMADFNAYKTTTDDQGQFSLEQVPPGEGAMVRLIRTSPNSWTHSDSTPVTVKPGETTQVTLGGNGALLVGRIRFDNPPTNAAALSFEGSVSTQMPAPPAFHSAQEAQAFYRSPERRALMKLVKNYALEMRPDGSFTVDNVAPGAYTLNVDARAAGERRWEGPALGHGTLQVSVPDSFDPAAPMDLGEVVLTPSRSR